MEYCIRACASAVGRCTVYSWFPDNYLLPLLGREAGQLTCLHRSFGGPMRASMLRLACVAVTYVVGSSTCRLLSAMSNGGGTVISSGNYQGEARGYTCSLLKSTYTCE